MEESTLYLITQVFIAIGTTVVCILAVWGDKIRSYIAGPRLRFELHNPRGDLTLRRDGRRTIYYHVKIKNERHWAAARRVHILCNSISKKAPDGSFVQEPLIIPVPLTWAFPTFHELLPTISADDICDLGYLDEGSNTFKLSLYIYPNNFRGFIGANEAMRVGLIATADNFISKSSYVLEISWDGKWSSDLNEMRKHLVIKEIR